MNTKLSVGQRGGMTLREVLTMIVLVGVLALWVLPAFLASRRIRSSRISCINNLKEIGMAYRIWENDNGGKYPAQQAEALGGMQGLLSNSASAGKFTYLNYSLMQNELGQAPKVVVCPEDTRTASTNYYYNAHNAPTESGFNPPEALYCGTFDNTNVSYFCGVGASDTYPQSILGGDRNLGNGGNIDPATGVIRNPIQDPNFGISEATTNPEYPCGADAIINTNGEWSYASISGGGGNVDRMQAVAWSAKAHSIGNPAGAGNILLGDGSAQQCTSAGLRQNWLRNATLGSTTNTGNFAASDKIHTTAAGDMRLLFP